MPYRSTRARKSWVAGSCGSSRTCDDAALLEEHHPVGLRAGEADLVGGHQDGRPRRLKIPHQVQHLADEHRAEGRGDLVEQLRLRGEHPHDGDALPLTAGYPIWEGACLAGQADALQQLQAPRLCLGPLGAMNLAGQQGDIVQQAQVWEQVVMLEHHADAGADGIFVELERLRREAGLGRSEAINLLARRGIGQVAQPARLRGK